MLWLSSIQNNPIGIASADSKDCYVLVRRCLCEWNIVWAFIWGNTVPAQASWTSTDKKND